MEKLKVTVLPFAMSLLIVLVIMPFIIRYFRKKQLGQMTRDEGPSWHKEKSGTPTMGGIAFVLSSVVTIFLIVIFNIEDLINVLPLIVFFVSYGSIGFIDDYIKVIMKRNLGLTSKQKFIAQLLLGLTFYIVLLLTGFDNQLNLPFIGNIHISYFYGIFTVFWLVGFSNATNLTDGIDGLLGTTSLIAYAGYAYIAYQQNNLGVLLFAFSIIGGLLGFLFFNKKPADIFMGDLGSLALGAGLATMSILLNMEWTLLMIGIIFVIETASVILQVTYFKQTGKRLLKMSPIHHHFEMEGWSERKIVLVFSMITLIAVVLT
ncbi:MAG: phospho-N-acetylmuramoyl-pentapeptide-transferase, partial [Atopostipes sp.]|nr:phospho-N-acetylmuramoyl-pentapeptide-transferase [Atopostipes sp.]